LSDVNAATTLQNATTFALGASTPNTMLDALI
jgi:hypothetical protein